jgi:GTP-binding protein
LKSKPFVHAQFVLSAASASDFPRTGFPEVALVGRSNVGKSSLINALVRKTVARTSAAPGKTRLANYYLIEPLAANRRSRRPSRPGSFYLVDLPGYGYARGGQESVEAFEALTSEYFGAQTRSGRRLAGVLHLVDARHPDLPQDEDAHEWLLRTTLPVAVVATKVDKLTRAERTRNLDMLESGYDTTILPASALEHEGLDDIWKTMRTWIGGIGA